MIRSSLLHNGSETWQQSLNTYWKSIIKTLVQRSNLSVSFRIGYAIAKGLAENGAKVVVSSRKQENVTKAVDKLRELNLDVSGVVCHVGKDEDRKNLLQTVSWRNKVTLRFFIIVFLIINSIY